MAKFSSCSRSLCCSSNSRVCLISVPLLGSVALSFLGPRAASPEGRCNGEGATSAVARMVRVLLRAERSGEREPKRWPARSARASVNEGSIASPMELLCSVPVPGMSMVNMRCDSMVISATQASRPAVARYGLTGGIGCKRGRLLFRELAQQYQTAWEERGFTCTGTLSG